MTSMYPHLVAMATLWINVTIGNNGDRSMVQTWSNEASESLLGALCACIPWEFLAYDRNEYRNDREASLCVASRPIENHNVQYLTRTTTVYGV
jgi:hypothetical protein